MKPLDHRPIVTLLACALLVACAGASRLARKDITPTEPMAVPSASAQDAALQAQVQTVILRNGAGAWAENAYWDEYLVTVTAAPGTELVSAELVGALDEVQPAQRKLSELRKGTRAMLKRYKHAGYDIAVGTPGYLATSAMVSGGAMVISGLTLAGATTATLVEGLATAATAGLSVFGGMALGVAGGIRVVKNVRMQNEIERRTPALPAVLPAQGELHLFFAVTPSPQRLRLHVRSDDQARVVEIPLDVPLASLHVRRPPAGAGGVVAPAAGN